jgi:hypothetical protein
MTKKSSTELIASCKKSFKKIKAKCDWLSYFNGYLDCYADTKKETCINCGGVIENDVCLSCGHVNL